MTLASDNSYPGGLMLGGDFTVGDYLLWNEIPTVVVSLVGGVVFVGTALYLAHGRQAGARTSSAPAASGRERELIY